ncbi:HesA/MoeB/ThiF family protein [Alteromonas oceani]|uniref:HesA/MoeB/ThiF family protein n=1 Tax=Alteromonas oceani TaxID=2071609 RepID=A0ABV7JYT2_9ALTE|nr:HesA/MoeB/ThiF family protein [Alteromonas oceani]
MHVLSRDDYVRYSRQLLVTEMDEVKQQALSHAEVVIVGLGGLGCAVAPYLAGAGVGRLRLVDGDEVALSNLPRQPLYAEQDIGETKARVACLRLRDINRTLSVQCYATRLVESNAESLLNGASVVLDCTDNMASRQLINQVCYQLGVPLISGAASGTKGQLLMLHPHRAHGCYRCLYEPEQSEPNTCLAQGILGPVVGIVGMMQALHTLLFITSIAPLNWGELRLFDGFSGQWQALKLPPLEGCPVCGEHNANYS